jgi:hypothetical protein
MKTLLIISVLIFSAPDTRAESNAPGEIPQNTKFKMVSPEEKAHMLEFLLSASGELKVANKTVAKILSTSTKLNFNCYETSERIGNYFSFQCKLNLGRQKLVFSGDYLGPTHSSPDGYGGGVDVVEIERDLWNSIFWFSGNLSFVKLNYH